MASISRIRRKILIAGKETRIESAADANRKGIGMVFQEQSLLTNLTVGENIYLGNERQFTRFGLVHWRALYDAAARQLDKVQVDIDPRTRADELDFAARQMVELAKALTLEEHAAGHLVILLDEPTSVLERAEIDILFDRVRALKSRASFVFVSHRLDEVLELSDRVYVMKDGEVVAELAAADADVGMLHRLMVGRTQQADYYREPLQMPVQDAVVLEADQLACGAAYRNVSFKLHAGEILGIAGVIGSGREELTRTLAGFAPHTAGTLKVAGREVRLETPAEAVDLGIGYIPRERRVEGLVLFLVGCRQHHSGRSRKPHALRPDQRPRGAKRRDRLDRPAQSPHAEHRHPVPQPFWRQPAEGGAREVAERQGENSHPRPSDAWPRRRR